MNKIHLNFRRNKALCRGVEQSATQEWEYIKIIWKSVIIFPWRMLRKVFFFFFSPWHQFSSFQSAQSCPTLCNPMNCSKPGFPVQLQHPELVQTCRSSKWCHPMISSYVIPFSSCLQSFPASESYLMSQFFTLASQSIGVSGSAYILPMYIQNWFPLGLTGLISLQSKRLSRVFSNTRVQKYQFFGA